MDWLCYFAREWDRPRQAWEDVYILPRGEPELDQALWLTINALGELEDSANYWQGVDFRRAQASLAGRDFRIDATEMLVRTRDFDRAELLHWTAIWLCEIGLIVDSLVEADRATVQGQACDGGQRGLLGGQAAGGSDLDLAIDRHGMRLATEVGLSKVPAVKKLDKPKTT